MIVTFKSKCGILHGVIIWSMEFLRNEMKVMTNNNVVDEVLDSGHRNCDFLAIIHWLQEFWS